MNAAASPAAAPRTDSREAFSARPITGTLHLFVAFDWGEEIDLPKARELVPSEFHLLPRAPRTPSSIGYRPPPLRFKLAPVPLKLVEIGDVTAPAQVTVFDFAAASLDLSIPFTLSASSLSTLAGWLAEPGTLVAAAREAAEPLFRELEPAIHIAEWSDLTEEFFVFEFAPEAFDIPPSHLVKDHGEWVASLVRLEHNPLSPGEVAEALRLRLSYSPEDAFIADWAAAVVIDRDSREILETVAWANLQLLEFRHIDERLDGRLGTAYDLIHQLARRSLPFWQTNARPLRALGELKVEANEMFERTGNVLKLMGDQYLARVYQLLVTRMHLDEWGSSIRRSIDVLESVYQVVADQSHAFRAELLELIIVLLILWEIVVPMIRG